MKGTAVKQKRPLSLDDLGQVLDYYPTSTQHNDLLFIAMLLTGFFALIRLGELAFPDDRSLHDWQKITHRESVLINAQFYEFHLPHHKADVFLEGNHIIVWKDQFRHNPLHHFLRYSGSKKCPNVCMIWKDQIGVIC